MKHSMQIENIATIHTDFHEKFGIPRQSGLTDGLSGKIIFEPQFRNPDALRGIEQFSHLWLIWEFSDIPSSGEWSPTVRPPRLGGNRRVGVFATRSPYRKNRLGLSSVKLDRVDYNNEDGAVLYVSGADLLDGTPIYDIKPYLPITDCHPEAHGGFSDEHAGDLLTVNCPPEMTLTLPEPLRPALFGILAQDPRPSYQSDPERIYGMNFADYNIKFRVEGDILTVTDITRIIRP